MNPETNTPAALTEEFFSKMSSQDVSNDLFEIIVNLESSPLFAEANPVRRSNLLYTLKELGVFVNELSTAKQNAA